MSLNLNAEQQQVVDHDGHSVVVACPGSGKTRVVVIKIARILAQYPTARVCAVTFTRDAANELKERLIKEIGEEAVNKRARIGTFHSLAIRQLRHHQQLGKVASPSEQFSFVLRAISSIEDPITVEDAVQIIETVKSSRTTVPEADHPVYLAYAKLLTNAKVEDLYDVLRKSLSLMQQGVIAPYPVNFMLVDEFQDTDEIQLAWVLEHVKANINVTVVGDDDQSVYSFRRALGYSGMERFRKATDATQITLSTNYRCRSEVLNAAKLLISHNQERVGKSLYAERGPGGSVTSLRRGDRADEVERIIEEVLKHLIPAPPGSKFAYTTPAGKWAVLARNRHTLNDVEQALSERGIKYLRPASDSIWSTSPFSYFIGILKSIQSGENEGINNLLHWLGVSQIHINQIALELDGHMWKLTENITPSMSGMPTDIVNTVTEFIKVAKGWRRDVKKGYYNEAIKGISGFFLQRITHPDVNELFARVSKSVENMRGTPLQRANTLTNPVREIAEEKNDSEKEAPTGVALMTMHGSKGLEFDNVWIIAAEDGVVPSSKNPVYDEERRLFYVAMTRARDHLFISCRVTAPPSPFTIEAGYDPRS